MPPRLSPRVDLTSIADSQIYLLIEGHGVSVATFVGGVLQQILVV